MTLPQGALVDELPPVPGDEPPCGDQVAAHGGHDGGHSGGHAGHGGHEGSHASGHSGDCCGGDHGEGHSHGGGHAHGGGHGSAHGSAVEEPKPVFSMSAGS
ncbi:unnamed protein product [Prorocentrum cordatum]|uniref:Uncharacterized protein n=1 Tax=Prorocentrum cordatum TaxID=2364126 RepID=A0ABN9TMK9_9DINO|nr:unnamed protein product [Polarella glacialis]